MKRVMTLVLPFSFAACQCDVGVDDVATESRKEVAGDDNSSTDVAVDDVDVDEANVDTDVDVDVDNDVDNDVDVNIGGGEGGEEEEEEGVAGDAAVGDGVSFVRSYQGIVDEHATLTPSVAAELSVSSVEWLLLDAVFDEATLIDDDDWFVWGDARDDGSYVLSAGFGAQALAPFVWGKETRFCDGECVARSISAVCSGRIVLRVWLSDGSFRDATGEHDSARLTCDEADENTD